MKRNILALGLLLPLFSLAQLNGSFILSGRVIGENYEGLASASVALKGSATGTVADSTGRFSLVVNQKLPFTIVISSVGFAPQEIEIKNTSSKLAVQLTTQTYLANAVVVTASRTSEKILKSPVSIE